MSVAQAEALFSTSRLDIVYLSPELAPTASAPLLGAPGFIEAEFGEPPTADFVVDLLTGLITGDPPPGLTRASVYPLGIALKGQSGFIGIAHMVMGFPTETTVFIGLLILAEKYHRKGYGKEFFQGVYDWARPQGINFIRVRLHPRHEAPKAFLDKIGLVDLPEKLSSGHAIWERKLPATED